MGMTRREWLKGVVAAGLVGAAGCAAWGSLWEPFDYEVAQLTDLHHSRFVPIGEVRRVVELANIARPDVVVLTGDYTTSRRGYIEPCAEALGELRAREGVWAVLGNHDHYTGAELTVRALTKNKVNVLSNANTVLRRGGGGVGLGGGGGLGVGGGGCGGGAGGGGFLWPLGFFF